MSIDPELVRDAVARKDAPGVRDLLRDATETDRRACARALRPLLRDDPALLSRLFPDRPRMVPVTGENKPDDVPDFMVQVIAGVTGGAFLIEDFRATPEGREHEQIVELRRCAAFLAAALGLAGGVAEAARVAQDYESFQGPAEHELDAIAGVLADRNPPWLAELVDRHLGLQSRFMLGIPAWPLARRLVRLGVIERPAGPAYATLMPPALRHGVEIGDHRWRLAATPAEELLADPGLLDDEVWRLFTVPDAAWAVHKLESWWHADEPIPGQTWAGSLAALAEQGHLDRSRLIDACLGAFLRDFAPTRVGWYTDVHERLDPSLTEMAARASTYLALLGVSATPGVKLAQQAAGRLIDAGMLDAAAFLAASRPALEFPRKNIVTAQLKLIGKLIRARPGVREAALVTAAQAFSHERADVQEAALKLIAGHGMPTGQAAAEISRLAAALAPSLASQAIGLGITPGHHGAPPPSGPGAAAEGAGAAAASEVRHGEVPGPALVRPAAGDPLPEPVQDPGELIGLFTRLLEDAGDALAAERALAGAVRLAHLPPAQRRHLAGPLLDRAAAKAAADHAGPFSGQQLTADLACVLLAWGAGWVYEGRYHEYSGWQPREVRYQPDDPGIMPRILTTRVREAAEIISRGRPACLLAEPGFGRGAISQQQLAGRLTAWYEANPGTPPARYDLEAALLRLTPQVDPSFWEEWERLDSLTAARAHRLHAEAQQPVPLSPVTGEPLSRPFSPGSGSVRVLARATGSHGHAESSTWALLTALSDPLEDHDLLYGQRWRLGRYDELVAGWPLLAPWQPELVAAHLLRPLSDGLKPGPSPATTAVTCLAHPGHALGPIGHLALLTGLASAEPDTRIAAAGVWEQACLDGRLDPRLAVDAIITGGMGKAFKLNRVADGLRHATSQPIAAYRAVEAVCRCVPDLLEARDPNLHLLVMLAADLAAAVGLPELPPALADLGRRGRTRLSAAAAVLASAAAGPAPDRAAAAAQAHAALVTRAEPGTGSAATA